MAAKAVMVSEYVPVQFRSPYKGMIYGMPDGKHIVFVNGLYWAKDEAERDFLKAHSDFNVSLFVVK